MSKKHDKYKQVRIDPDVEQMLLAWKAELIVDCSLNVLVNSALKDYFKHVQKEQQQGTQPPAETPGQSHPESEPYQTQTSVTPPDHPDEAA